MTEFSIFIASLYCSCAPSWIPLRLSFLGHGSILFFTIFILSRQSFLCCNRSFFGSSTICRSNSIVLTVLCYDNLMCGSLNSYVATSTILLRQSFYAASSNWCRDPFFMSQQHFCFGSCCNTVSCIVRISVATQKVCRDRFLSPVNLISYFNFIFML